ncbi:hypothetical protein D3C85_1557400 [compost metagenome]
MSTSRSSIVWMKWRNRLLSKNSGAFRPCRIDRRWAMTVHRSSSSSALMLFWPLLSSRDTVM